MKHAILAMLLALCISSFGQIQQKGQPYNWNKKSVSNADIPTITTESLNLSTIKAYDEEVDQYKETPYRFGIEREVNINLFEEAKHEVLNKGDKLWTLGVKCPKATSINFLFSDWYIPEGGQLSIWNKNRTEFIGVFTHENNKEYNSFAVGLVHDSEVFIEYYEPYWVEDEAQIRIGTIIHGYRKAINKWEDTEKGVFGNSGSCNMNVNCPDGADWQNEKRGVALILNGGSAWCTGSLINTTAQDGSEYFLTAAHCDATESNWVFYFNHEAAGCSNSTAPTNQSISGATQVASGSASDYHLVRLSANVPSSYDPYYNGWDRSGSAVPSAVGIHHPSGDIKKISFDDDPLTTTSYLSSTSSSSGNHWRVETWERNTTTEGGSSGSPLFDQNHRIIGQLHGGYAACGNTTSDWYGALESSWIGLGTYLDPLGTGALTLDGYDPSGGTQPTCNDGIQNGTETGVDCGGSCNACACSGTEVMVSITFDNYPEETSWSLTQGGSALASGGTYASQADGSTLNIPVCLADGCFDFTINDVYGDGICCSYGNGSYTVSANGSTLVSGGSFTSSETTNFCIGGGPSPTCNDGIQNQGETGVDCGGPCTACTSCNDGIQNQGESGVDCGGPCAACPTCSDGIQNQGETGVDCGGPCSACTSCNDGIQNQGETGVDCGGPCAACPTCSDGIQNGDETGVDCGGSCAPCNTGGCTDTSVDSHDFEANWGIWNDGGSDCRRSANDAAYSFSGSRSARLRDNTSTSVTTTDNLNLSAFEDVTIDFYFYARSMESGEDFWVQYSTNGGSSYTTVASYARGTSFENNSFYSASVDIDGPFSSTTRFRFRCDASGNSDWVYIDDVNITGCSNGNMAPITSEDITESEELVIKDDLSLSELLVYPNPTQGNINVNFELSDNQNVSLLVVDLQGRTIINKIISGTAGMNIHQLETAFLEKGTYLLILNSVNERITERFVVYK